MEIIKKLISSAGATPPEFILDTTHFLVKMGSSAYGTRGDASDIDIYGVCVPPKSIILPHTVGVLVGFDKDYCRFDQYQQHHLMLDSQEYDVNIYNIIKYFRLCTDGNPNMVDSLFVPEDCIIYQSNIGTIMRENRKLFLSKKCWHTYKGYAYQQLHKMRTKGNTAQAKRQELFKKYGYNTKYAYHLVRLLKQVEQILKEEDMDLRRNSQELMGIKNGEWTLDQVESYFAGEQTKLESLYSKSPLPYEPREGEIKELLVHLLKMAKILD